MNSHDLKLQKLFNDYIEEYLDKFPTVATYLGYKHEKYDHLIDETGIDEFYSNLRWFLKKRENIISTIDYANLSEEGKIDYDLVLYYFELSLFNWTEHDLGRAGGFYGWGTSPLGYLGDIVYSLFSRDYAPVETRVDAIISRINAFPEYLESSKSMWIYPVKLWTEKAIGEGIQTKNFLYFVYTTLKPEISEEQSDKLLNSIKNIENNLADYQNWLTNEILPKATHVWEIGKQKFSRLISIRKLGVTPEEILEYGYTSLKETKIKIEQLGQKIDPQKTPKELRESIRSFHPPTFEMVLEHVGTLVKETREFIEKEQILTLPENEDLRVTETPAFMRKVLPFAAYSPAEKYSKNQNAEYWVTPIEDLSRLNEFSYSGMKNIAVHEGYPGHHNHFCWTNRNKNSIRTFVSGSETIEGWAHYCEEMMFDRGFLGDKERFLQLYDQIWRAARIIIDVKLSSGEMTFKEAINMLIEEVGFGKEAATGEVLRYTFSPGYQLSYLYGKKLLLDLKNEIKEQLGDLYSDFMFHNTLLEAGAMPIHFLRRLFEIKMKQLKEP